MTTKPVAPVILDQWLAPFEALFTGPTWQNLLVLFAGALLAPGRRTVTSALSVLGLRTVAGFTNFHRVLNRNLWLSSAAAKRLLHLLLGIFAPDGLAYRSCLRTTGYLRYRIDGLAIDDHRHRRDDRAPLGVAAPEKTRIASLHGRLLGHGSGALANRRWERDHVPTGTWWRECGDGHA